MASDEDYASFLDKANQDTGATKVSSQSQSVGTKAVNTEVPQALQQVEEYYTSEADEPFEPVSLKWEGDKAPSESEFPKSRTQSTVASCGSNCVALYTRHPLFPYVHMYAQKRDTG